MRRRERRESMKRLIDQLGLEKVRRNKGYMLSGGERRRVEIARSLVIDPSFLLLDEPFSGIDPIQVLELQRIIFDLKRTGIGILITDHNVRETLAVTDRAYIINNGHLAQAARSAGRDAEVRRVYLGENFSMGLQNGKPSEVPPPPKAEPPGANGNPPEPPLPPRAEPAARGINKESITQPRRRSIRP